MSLSQLIYTSTCISEMSPRLSHEISYKSIKVCEQLGLTGRVFASDIQAFAMTEGPTAMVKKYFEAVQADPRVETILLHVERPIKKREFQDYSVWLNSAESFDFGPYVRVLTPESLEEALPSHPSIRLRIMVEAFKEEVLAA